MDIKELIFPIWEGDTVMNETILPIGQSERDADIRLFFEPDEILSVKSWDLKKEYVKGQDWIFESGKIKLLTGSEIPYMKASELHFYEKNGEECFNAKNGGYILYKRNGFFHKKQTVVTYTHKDSVDFGLPVSDGKILCRAIRRLQNGEKLKICFYGDSITAGYDGSGLTGIEPNMPGWAELVKMGLELRYDSKIELINTAVGGKRSDWGAECAQERIACYKPDVAVIAFGMNDGTGMVAPAEFRKNIMKIKSAILEKNSECEFIFISTTLANPESCFDGLQREYYDELLFCASECDAVVNMTKIHDILLKKKHFADMTGNNINHPNDFLIRIYAQAVLSLF